RICADVAQIVAAVTSCSMRSGVRQRLPHRRRRRWSAGSPAIVRHRLLGRKANPDARTREPCEFRESRGTKPIERPILLSRLHRLRTFPQAIDGQMGATEHLRYLFAATACLCERLLLFAACNVRRRRKLLRGWRARFVWSTR